MRDVGPPLVAGYLAIVADALTVAVRDALIPAPPEARAHAEHRLRDTIRIFARAYGLVGHDRESIGALAAFCAADAAQGKGLLLQLCVGEWAANARDALYN